MTNKPAYIRHGQEAAPLRLCLSLSVLFCLLLSAVSCAPQEISSGASRVDAEYYGPSGPDPVSDMRYPMSGSLNRHREEYFYRMSQPAIFESVQNWRKEQFARSFRALNPEEPAYREKPRQRSPFRE